MAPATLLIIWYIFPFVSCAWYEFGRDSSESERGLTIVDFQYEPKPNDDGLYLEGTDIDLMVGNI